MSNLSPFSSASPLMSALGTIAAVAVVSPPSLAQSSVSSCQPPQSNEYLILVVTSTPDSQDIMRRTLPREAKPVVCNYQGETVTRIDGFQTIEDADLWGRYLQEIVGLSPVIAQPASGQQTSTSSSSTETESSPPSTSTPNTQRYNPQPLENGYAILVDYFHQPEIAAQVREIVGQDVGLASYLARPYLLGLYTQNQQEANTILRRLSDRGFWVVVVDSRRVMLLTPVVSY